VSSSESAVDSPRQAAVDSPRQAPEAVIEASAGAAAPAPTARIADDALIPLESLTRAPLVDHADIYQRVHEQLQGALAEIDGV
jgi:hypothetical protein